MSNQIDMAVKKRKKTLFAARPKASNIKKINKHTPARHCGLSGLHYRDRRPLSGNAPSGRILPPDDDTQTLYHTLTINTICLPSLGTHVIEDYDVKIPKESWVFSYSFKKQESWQNKPCLLPFPPRRPTTVYFDVKKKLRNISPIKKIMFYIHTHYTLHSGPENLKKSRKITREIK